MLIKNIILYICINIKTNTMTKQELIDKIIEVYLVDGKNMFQELYNNKINNNEKTNKYE